MNAQYLSKDDFKKLTTAIKSLKIKNGEETFTEEEFYHLCNWAGNIRKQNHYLDEILEGDRSLGMRKSFS